MLSSVVISGGSGLIGVALTNYLTDRGIRCLLLVLKGSFCPDYYRHPDKVAILECSMDEYKSIAKSARIEGKWDAFIHLSWAGTFGNSRDDTNLQAENIQGTLDALELAASLGCMHFVGVGSQAEYGRGVHENPHSIQPTTGYGIAKYAAGKLAALRAKQLGLAFNWVRVFSVYGPYAGEKTITQYVVRSLIAGVSPSLTPCEQLWDFLYVDDAAAALAAIADKGKDGVTYELGSGVHKPLKEYLSAIPTIIGVEIGIHFGDLRYPDNQVMSMCADIVPLTKDTGWAPKVSFEDGIKSIYRSLQQNH